MESLVDTTGFLHNSDFQNNLLKLRDDENLLCDVNSGSYQELDGSIDSFDQF